MPVQPEQPDHAAPIVSSPNGRIALVTAGDEQYFYLIDNLLASLQAAFLPSEYRVCVLDLGFSAAQRANLDSRVDTIVTPGWHIDFPLRSTSPSWFRAMVSRPFLPDIFPDFHTYLWLDADTWVQRGDCLVDMVSQSSDGRIALVFEVFGPPLTVKLQFPNGKIYAGEISEKSVRISLERCYTICFGPDAARHAAGPVTNSGVFAIKNNSPVWTVWQDYLTRALRNMKVFEKLAEQQSLNLAFIEGAIQVAPMPFRCNWNITTCRPLIDLNRRVLIDPADGNLPLGVVHLNDLKANRSISLRATSGTMVNVPLQFRDFHAQFPSV